ncbi:hypothetical protein B0T10DRAFT_610736 [Thelonectria olida]|uniref:ATP-dependent RNA helicase n=1 Tax=Thelonectria olida TaxID=1576542 RepID=A0A9P8VUD6_9HYPO|nr:hypothetical protein B0T10DRAFT_610736 [Thelonectria olida]
MKAPAQLHQSYIIVPARLRLVTLVSYLKSTLSRRGRTMQAIISVLRRLGRLPLRTSEKSHRERIASIIFEGRGIHIQDGFKGGVHHLPASPKVILHRMHGPLSKPFRTATLRSFSACKSASLLITTNVSCQGLDIPSVDLVIEYDPAFSFAKLCDALLFLLPGCEDGYIELLKSSTPPTPQSYDSSSGFLLNHLQQLQSYHDKAEVLQLHFEQRLLDDTKRLELAREGFKSHIRAYATHITEERVNFHITELHSGHIAKIFGLRKAPA